MNRLTLLFLALLVIGCKTVVESTSTEIRPSRYAMLELTRPIPQDSMIAYVTRAVKAESIKVVKVDRAAGQVTAGPVRFEAGGGQPSLDASVTITSELHGAETKVRIFASSIVAQGQMGGQDARLTELVQRIERRLDSVIGR